MSSTTLLNVITQKDGFVSALCGPEKSWLVLIVAIVKRMAGSPGCAVCSRGSFYAALGSISVHEYVVFSL